MTKVKEITKTATGDIADFVGIASVDEIDAENPIVDIKLLKKALLHIEQTAPTAKSIRFVKVEHYPHNGDGTPMYFLGLTTKTQEADKKNPVIHVICPLTTHVDKADMFEDTDPQVFLGEHEPVEVKKPNGLSLADLIASIEPDGDDEPKREKKRTVVSRKSHPDAQITAAGYKKPKRGRKPKVPEVAE